MKEGRVPPGFVGVFRFRYRALEDLGIVEDSVTINGKWTAKWKKASKEEFLSSIRLQYDAFKCQAVLHNEWLYTRYFPSIGSELEGLIATPSGLLAVMKALGVGCFEKWLGGDRLSYANLTFREMNGIF
jgi:hypothetical protein